MNTEILAYAAGIVDGEGCIWISVKPCNLHVSVANTKEELMLWLKNFFGGTYHLSALTAAGKNSYTWRKTGIEAKNFLMQILPFLTIKKDRASLVLPFPTKSRGHWCTPEEREHREEIRQKLVRLNA